MKASKKRIIKISSIVLVTFIAVFSFINLRYPTKINAYIAHTINKEAPANASFTDENLYNAVVDAYNEENGTSLPYTTSLSDAQLRTIKELIYESTTYFDVIKNTAGLEKLTSLTKLVLRRNATQDFALSTIDLSKNTELTYLDLYGNGFEQIDLSNNTKLTYLDLKGNGFTNIDLSYNTELEYLDLETNNFTDIDLSANTKLTYLDIGNLNENVGSNRLTSIDLSKNTELVDVDLDFNNLTSIDLSKNTKLATLRLYYNAVINIDLSKNTELTYLDLASNSLTSVDLSKNTKLTTLYLNGNALTSIDLSKNTKLTTLGLSSNDLTNIDFLSKNIELTNLNLANNALTNVDLSKYINLTEIELYGNPLKYNDYVRKGGSISNRTIKLPENSSSFYPRYKSIDNETITYDEYDRDTVTNVMNNKLKSLSVGQKSVSVYLYGIRQESGTSPSLNLTGTITVYDFNSTKYNINEEMKYIYTKTDTDSNTILSNINFQYINGKIENNKLILYNEDIIVDEYTIVNVKSAEYDLTKEYIYVGNSTFNKNNITVVNGTVEENNNVLDIKYNGTILESKKIVKVTSTKYDLTKSYISDSNFDKDSITVINGTLEVKDNKLYIKYNDDVLKTYDILASSTLPGGRLKGDIDNNGTINLWDVTLLYMHIRGTRVITDQDTLEAGKLTGNQSVTLGDVTKLYRYIRGSISEL